METFVRTSRCSKAHILKTYSGLVCEPNHNCLIKYALKPWCISMDFTLSFEFCITTRNCPLFGVLSLFCLQIISAPIMVYLFLQDGQHGFHMEIQRWTFISPSCACIFLKFSACIIHMSFSQVDAVQYIYFKSYVGMLFGGRIAKKVVFSNFDPLAFCCVALKPFSNFSSQ